MQVNRWTVASVLCWATLASGCNNTITTTTELPTRRLTPTQYNHTVRDLFHMEEHDFEEDEGPRWPWRFPADIPIHGFEGLPEGQVASPYLIEQYQVAGAYFASYAVEDERFYICDPEGEEEEVGCIEKSLLNFAQRAYRRPLTPDESSRVSALFQGLLDTHDLEESIQLTVQGVLMSPQFLYRLDGSPDTPVTESYALAARMSYFLWNSMPDAELFEAAANDELQTAKQVETQAKRMLEDPRAREAVVHFHRQWLDLQGVYLANADMNTYLGTYLPEAEDAIEEDEVLFVEAMEELWTTYLIGVRAAMVKEAELFVEKTIFAGDGSLKALLTENQGYIARFDSFVGEDLGTDRIYGVSEDDWLEGDEYRLELSDGNVEYSLDFYPAIFPSDERAGILTLGAVLASHSHPVHPAPVLRGVFIKERLLCQSSGQPPEGAEGAAPPDSLDVDSTNRQRLEAITSPPECIVCHESINPLGFALENFDSLGGYRTQDNGLDVDASGTLPTGERFDNAVDLAHHLAKQRETHDCYVEHWSRVAYGMARPDEEVLFVHQTQFMKKKGDVQKLILSIVSSNAFRNVSGGEE